MPPRRSRIVNRFVLQAPDGLVAVYLSPVDHRQRRAAVIAFEAFGHGDFEPLVVNSIDGTVASAYRDGFVGLAHEGGGVGHLRENIDNFVKAHPLKRKTEIPDSELPPASTPIFAGREVT